MTPLQVVQQGQDLAAAIAEASDVMATSNDGSESAPLDAQARVQLLLEFLHDRQLDLEELAEERRARFEQCVQLGKYIYVSLLVYNFYILFIICFPFIQYSERASRK